MYQQGPITQEERIEQIINQVKRNVRPAEPTTGSTAGDTRTHTDRQIKAAVNRVAMRFALTVAEAEQVLRARASYDASGWVDASHAIIRENPRTKNLY